MEHRNERILVLGATGRLGRLVVDEALTKGYRVRAAVRRESQMNTRERLEVIEVDLNDKNSLANAMMEVTAIVCTLAPPMGFRKVSVMGSCLRHIIDAMNVMGIERLLLCSCNAATHEGYRALPFSQYFFIYPVRLRGVYNDMGNMETAMTRWASDFSNLAYTVIRLPRLINSSTEGDQLLVNEVDEEFNARTHAAQTKPCIGRSKVAEFIIASVENAWERAIVSIGVKR